MATKKPRATPPHPGESEGRPLQRRHIDPVGWKQATASWAEMGNVKSRISGEIEKHTEALADPSRTPQVHKRSQKALNNLTDIQSRGLVVDKPITVQSAARRRLSFFDAGARRNAAEGDITGETASSTGPVGAGWYFGHTRDIKNISQIEDPRPTPEAHRRFYAASGSMSPLNSPANEKAAMRAITGSYRADHDITPTTPRGAEAAGVGVGETTSISQLSHEQMGKISNSTMHAHLETRAPLAEIGKAGANIDRGLSVLHGEVPPENFAARGHAGAPKLSGYVSSMFGAGGANANETSEYYRRVHEATPKSEPYFRQPTIFGKEWEKDPYGHAQSTKGILDPGGDTAEDTWMNAISYGQPHEMETLKTGKGSARVGKVLASDTHGLTNIPAGGIFPSSSPKKDYPVGSEQVLHALNQEATHSAARMATRRAEKAGRNMGAGLPAVAMQESSWTEYRIQAGKSDEYTAAVEDRGRQSEFDKHGTTIHKGQKKLF